jgi:ABC-2 type transport system ATP-binding protein
MNNACIAVKGISKKYGIHTVLKNIDLTIPHGQIYGLLGPSGAGKTTLIRMLVGIDNPDCGMVRVLGELMPKLSIMEQIGYMGQADALYEELTALQNLEFFGSLYGLRGQKLKKRAEHVLELVLLSDDINKKVSQFSGGMKRRLSLAIALLANPRLLILDEPTVGIDPRLRKTIWKQFGILRDSGISIILTTHVMDEADKCDSLGMIQGGRLIASGTPCELKKKANADTIEDVFLVYGEMEP